MVRQLSFPSHSHCQALTSLMAGAQARLAQHGQPRRYQAGQMIYGMGEATDHLYLVLSGRVRTSLISPEGRELVVGLYGPGELFGELCFCSVRQRQEQAVAVEETRVVKLEVKDLLAITTSSKAGALDLLELFCHRLAGLQEQLAELAFASVRTRLGFLLFRLAEDGRPAPAGGVVSREYLTHDEIAARVSTTREQVTSILAGFRKRGLVEYRRGGPLIIYPQRLREYLETENV